MKVFFCWTLALTLIFGSFPTSLSTSTNTAYAKAVTKTGFPALTENSISLLPKSDVVAVLDIRRLVNDLLPKAKEAWPDAMAKAEKEINEIISQAAKDGVDLYKIKSLTLGLKLFGDKVTGAMIVDGLTVTPEMLAQEDKDSKVVEYKGKTLYIETPKPAPPPPAKAAAKRTTKRTTSARTKTTSKAKAKTAKAKKAAEGPGVSPLGDVKDLATNMGSELLKGSTAFVQLDTERMAFGDEAEVKAVIDALTGSPDPAMNIGDDLMAALRETRANSLLRFAINIPESARQMAEGEQFLKNLALTKMVLGTLDITDELSLSLDTRLRTGSAEEATKLHESLAALLGLGKMMLGGNQDPLMLTLNKLLEQIQLSPQANDVTLGITIPREFYESFLKPDPKTTPAKNDK